MSIDKTKRKRLSPEESRAEAISAARELLLADGPQAVTLKAVAAKVGKTHANVLHHFGSAVGLQKALAKSIADSVTGEIAISVAKARQFETDVIDIVDQTFDAFGKHGGGQLAAWMILSGNRDALDPILDAIRLLVQQLTIDHEGHGVPELTLSLVLAAIGDSLLGAPVAEALGLPRDTVRHRVADDLRRQLEIQHGKG